MCFGSGFRAFPHPSGPSAEDAPNLRLQPSLSAPVSDAGVLSLPQGKPPIPPMPSPDSGELNPPSRGRGPGAPRSPASDLYGLRMFLQ